MPMAAGLQNCGRGRYFCKRKNRKIVSTLFKETKGRKQQRSLRISRFQYLRSLRSTDRWISDFRYFRNLKKCGKKRSILKSKSTNTMNIAKSTMAVLRVKSIPSFLRMIGNKILYYYSKSRGKVKSEKQEKNRVKKTNDKKSMLWYNNFIYSVKDGKS